MPPVPRCFLPRLSKSPLERTCPHSLSEHGCSICSPICMLEAGLLRLWIVFFAGMGGSLPAGLDQEGRIEVEGLGGFLLAQSRI